MSTRRITGRIATFAAVGIAVAAAGAASTGSADAATGTQTNAATITIPDVGTATPYPSSVTVSGMPVGVTDVNVALHGLTHTFPEDVEIMLVGPTGQHVVLLNGTGADVDVTDLELTVDDEAAGPAPDTSALINGSSYKPTNIFPGDTMSAPAPATATAVPTLTGFDSTDPNGIWSLYVQDQDVTDMGGITRGWSLQLTTVDVPGAPTITSPATRGFDDDGVVTFGGAAQANSIVRILEGASQVASVIANSSGAYAVSLAGVADGSHSYTATATDAFGNLSAPSGAVTVTVDTVAPTVVRTKPAKRATGVRVGRNITATVSEAAAAGTITRANIKLVKAGRTKAVRAAVTYNAAKHKITINPRRPLAHGTSYRVTIGIGVKDLAGNNLDQKPRPGLQKKTWRFTTG